MSLNAEPKVADKIIKFDGTPGRASVLRYDVSMPGRYRGRRVLSLDLGLVAADVLTSATAITPTVIALDWTQQGDLWTYHTAPARDLWFSKAMQAWSSTMVTNLPMSDFLGTMQGIARAKPDLNGTELDPVAWGELIVQLGTLGNQNFAKAIANMLVTAYGDYVRGLARGQLTLPVRRWDGQVVLETSAAKDVLSTSGTDAHFFLIEVFGISSFLGDYGLGRTVRTFTLLPGEETRISMKTWRTDTTKASHTTSIVDSYDEKSASRFNDTVQAETTDKQTRNDKLSWHVEAEVSASWGWGNAKVSGGAAGENQSGREQFSKDVINSVKEHSAEAASNRSNTVSLATETTTVAGQETATERTVRNINLRRVLNFVFRELNQEYSTVVHLMEVKVGFATSTTDSYREVPIAGLRPLLEDILVAGRVGEVAQQIIGLAGTVMAESGTPVTTLEKLILHPDGSYAASAAAPDAATGLWNPPPADRAFLYRWKPGPLGQPTDAPRPVDGVVMASTPIVMPTADLVVEALLGQADALDEFAMYSQAEDAEARALANRRLSLSLDTLEAIADPKERADTWAKVFPPATTNA